ncbi:MAG: penicillin-binding protein 2 [Enterovibrio sp.]
MRKKHHLIRNHLAESQLFFRRAWIAFGFVVVLFGVLLTNLYFLQILQFDSYRTRSNDNRIKVVPVPPKRGLIFDRNGKLLADNRPVTSLELIPEQVSDLEETIARLKVLLPRISDRDVENFKKEQKRSRRFDSVTLLDKLTDEEQSIFAGHRHKFTGVQTEANLKRFYPYGEALTHVIGYVAKINDRDVINLRQKNLLPAYAGTRDIGKIGIENFYENELHGQVGFQQVEVNNRGRTIQVLDSKPPQAGKDLYLTIDIELQLYIHSLLEGRRASVVVLNPKDASVLAMVSTPSYDPNLFVHGIPQVAYNKLINPDRPLVNRSTMGTYPPASTVKPFIAIAALTEKVVTPKTTRNDPGKWSIPGSTSAFHDWKRGGHGRVNILQSLEESVDTFFYQIGYDMTINKLEPWMRNFGFGQRTGIDIKEETTANMPSPEWKVATGRGKWFTGDTIPVAIGQGYWTATPLQIANAMTILLNRGTVNQPHLLKALRDPLSQQVSEVKFEPKASINNVAKEHWDLVLEGMHRVNHGSRGTARNRFIGMSYETGGKTGTAQLVKIKRDENNLAKKNDNQLHDDHALYTGFAPFDDPELIVVILLENAGGGSTNSAPIARKIFDYVLLKDQQTTPSGTDEEIEK